MREGTARAGHDVPTPGDERTAARCVQLAMLETIDAICRAHHLRYYMVYGTLLGAVRHGSYIPWDDDVDLAMPREDYERFLEIALEALDPERYFLQTGATDPEYPLAFGKIRARHTLMSEASRGTADYHEGVFVDIFPLDLAPNTRVGQTVRGLRYLSSHLAIRRKLQGYRPGRILLKAISAPLSLLSLERLQKRRYKIMTKDLRRGRSRKVYAAYPAASADVPDSFHSVKLFGEGRDMPFLGLVLRAPEDAEGYLREHFGDYMTLPPPEERNGHDVERLSVDREVWADAIRRFAPEVARGDGEGAAHD